MEIITSGFGYLIAFVLPGLIALKGIGLAVPAVGDWLDRATESASMGLYLLVVAVGVGLFLSAVRALLIDRWMPKEPKGRRRPEAEPIYQNLLAQHYMYGQFYGNSMPATAAFVVGWVSAAPRPPISVAIAVLLGVAVEYVLFRATRDTKLRLKLKIEDLLDQPGAGEPRKEHV